MERGRWKGALDRMRLKAIEHEEHFRELARICGLEYEKRMPGTVSAMKAIVKALGADHPDPRRR